MSQPAGRSRSALVSGFVFVFAAVFYSLFTAPGLLPADSGEFQVVAPLLGVAHPPGFPLYTLLGKVFVSLAPFGAPAYRLNLLSAGLAALTLVFVQRAAQTVTGSAPAGLLAAAVLGVSTTFWSQATTANVRMLTALCAALALYQLARLRAEAAEGREQGTRVNSQLPITNYQPPTHLPVVPPQAATKGNPSSLVPFAFALGLGISHHASLAFMGAVFAACAALRLRSARVDWRDRRAWLPPLLAFGAPFLFNLYLPLRGAAGAFLAPPHLATLPGFLEHVLARGFEGDFFYFAHPRDLPDRLRILGTILAFQFNPALLAGMALGGVAALRRDWWLFGLLAGAFGMHSFVAVTYRAPQTVEYMLPAYVVLAVALGYGFHAAGGWLLGPGGREQGSPLVAAYGRSKGRWVTGYASRITHYVLRFAFYALRLALLFAPLALFARNLPGYRQLARDESARTYAEAVLAAAPEGALVLASWHWATPLWYLQQIEGLRPDVEVQYVFPQGESLAQNWVERIAANAGARPVIVTSFYPPEFVAAGYRFAPLGPAWLASAEPVTAPPYPLAPVEAVFGGRWRLAGLLLHRGEARPGETLEVIAAWVAPEEPEDIHFFAQLIGPDGALYGQADVSHRAANTAPGEYLLDRYPIAIQPDAPPGDYALIAGAYRPDGSRLRLGEGGQDHVRLYAIRIGLAQTPPATRHPVLRPAPGTRLIGYDYDRSLPDSVRLYLHWRLGDAAETATIWQGGSPFAEVALPAGPGYLTTALDLPPHAARVQAVLGPPRAPWPLDWRAYNLPAPPAGARYVPLGGSFVLTGVDMQPAGGDEVIVDLELVAAGALTEDDVIKVDLIGPGYAWRAESNSIPAGGAIPTLKWVSGSLVRDRHRLRLPAQAAAGPARLELAAYDHFTNRVLPILDPRLALLGSTVPLGEIEVAP